MIALKNINIDDVLFIDIETVRIQDSIKKGEPLYESFDYKMRYSRESDKFEDKPIEEQFKDKAALYAEFAKVVCITIGKVKDGKCVLHNIYNHNEKDLLTEFHTVLESLFAKNPKLTLSGHAIVGFDIPFLMRRCLINRVSIPFLCDVAHLKPWEVKTLDTLNLWKGTGFYGASLINVATAFGLPSPKSDINGSETSDVYYNEPKGLERIKDYCERDVHTVCNVLLCMMGLEPVECVVGKEKIEVIKLAPLEKAAKQMQLTKEDTEYIDSKMKKIPKKDKEKQN